MRSSYREKLRTFMLLPSLTLSILALNLGAIATAQSFTFSKSGRFVFPASSGKELLNQCSRSAPQKITEFWQPTAEEIDELEAALPKYLEQRGKDGKPNPPKGITYHRQYIGFVKNVGAAHNRERFIYGNFYPERDGEDSGGAKQAVMVCDGGPAFWGIVYRPSTKTFEDPAFNGRG